MFYVPDSCHVIYIALFQIDKISLAFGIVIMDMGFVDMGADHKSV